MQPALSSTDTRALTGKAWWTPRHWWATIATMLLVMVTAYYVYRSSPTVLFSDSWYFVERVLQPWHEGRLHLADLFSKREGNHSQPLAMLLLVINAALFNLDFKLESLLGYGFALLFLWRLYRLLRQEGISGARLSVATLVLACVVLSINTWDKFGWSLVSLFFISHNIALTILRQSFEWLHANGRFLLLWISCLVGCVLVDSSGLLACAAAAVLVCVTGWRSQRSPTQYLAGALAIGLAVVAYKLGYKWFGPPMDGVGVVPSAQARLQILAGSWTQGWKAVVQPLSMVIVNPTTVAPILGERVASIWGWISAVLLVAAQLGFWVAFFRRRPGRAMFVSAGLMLYSYGVIAGILWGRVPMFGWDYFQQPRYSTFYEMQLVAIVIWVFTQGETVREFFKGRINTSMIPAYVVALGLPAAMLANIGLNFRSLVWIEMYWDQVAAQTQTLMDNPDAVIPECIEPAVIPCEYDAAHRRKVIQLMDAADWNVANPQLRAHHDKPGSTWRTKPSAGSSHLASSRLIRIVCNTATRLTRTNQPAW
jgi:hypothetical protein